MNGPVKKSAMVAGAFLALAAFTSVPADGAVRHRALLTNCSDIRDQSQILLFDVSPDSWEYVRTVVRQFDGHCRVPVSAVLIGDVVYVAEWAGWDDRALSNRSSAKILKYDIDGNYLGTLVDEMVDGNQEKVNRIGAMVASHDGRYLYVSQSFNGNTASGCCIYRYSVADGSGGAVLGPYSCPCWGSVCETSDGGTLFVTDRGATGTNVFTYSVSGGAFTRVVEKSYFKTMATSAYLDEDTQRLYVCGFNSGISVFDYASDNTAPIAQLSSGQYSHVRKVGGTLYAHYHGHGGCVQRLSYDPSDSTKLVVTDLMKRLLNIYNMPYSLMFNDFAVEDTGAVEVARYRFDESGIVPVYTNSVSPKYPMRAYRTRNGSTGVSGGALLIGEERSYAMIENSRGMLGGDFGMFMWMRASDTVWYVGTPLSNLVHGDNMGKFYFKYDACRFGAVCSLMDGFDINLTDRLNDRAWHHVGVVKKGASISMWDDGVKKDSRNGKGLGIDDSTDIMVGASGYGGLSPMHAGTAIDDLRLFDGAPDDAAVAAMYNEYSAAAASAAAPTIPALPSHDPTVANGYGTVVAHAFANQTPRTPPAVAVQTNGNWWVLSGAGNIPSSPDAKGVAYRTTDRGVSWALAAEPMAFHASPFECREDGAMYAVGRTACDRGATSYSIWFNNPTNQCDGRVGFTSCALRTDVADARTGFFTNDANRAVLRKANRLEPDLATVQEIYPGGGYFDGSRHYLAYCAGRKIGLISGAVTPTVGISDFRPEAATVESSAEKPFPGPVFASPNGEIATYVPDGTNSFGVALLSLASRSAIGDALAVAASGIELPGADRPFAVRYDSERSTYWAATTPGGGSLALYASKNLTEWTLATTVLTVSDTSTTRVSNPSFDFDGRDLVLAFNLTCPDGGPAPRSLDEPNYVMVRKVANFCRNSPFKDGFIMLFR
ncbi:MAG: hypothetical protein J6V72_06075 [Kiritimatiellae bacterium]|nr:hypothetical protein [Kiritimatiellia bacterium]